MLNGKQRNLATVVCKNLGKLMHHIWCFKVLLEEDEANNSFALTSCKAIIHVNYIFNCSAQVQSAVILKLCCLTCDYHSRVVKQPFT